MSDERSISPVLWTKNVYVDTEAFFNQNFEFASAPLARLKELCSAHKLILVMPDITVQEIKKKVRERILRSLQPILSARKKAYVLKGSRLHEVCALLGPIDENKIVSDLCTQVDEYLDECKARIILVSETNPRIVFDKYFSRQPPFSAGKKKAEFLDAFAIESCISWCKENSKRLYVVSQDEDHEKACEQAQDLRHFAKLSELLGFYNSAEEHLSKAATDRFEESRDSVAQHIKEALAKATFYTDDFVDAEVESVDIEEVDLDEWNLIDVDEDSATFEVGLSYILRADINYLESEKSYWDREEGEYLFTSRSNITQTVRDRISVSVYLETDDAFQTINSISSSFFSNMSTISIHIDDGYPYK